MSFPSRFDGASFGARDDDRDDNRADGLLGVAVERDAERGAVVVRLRGEIDHYTVPTLRDALADALAERPGPQLLVVDLAAVDFIGSEGLAELIAAADRAQRAGATMRLAAANATVRMLVAVTGTGGLLVLRPTVADAMAEPAPPG